MWGEFGVSTAFVIWPIGNANVMHSPRPANTEPQNDARRKLKGRNWISLNTTVLSCLWVYVRVFHCGAGFPFLCTRVG